MKTLFSLSFLILFVSTATSQIENYHNLLQKHVDAKGNVNYANFKKDESKIKTQICEVCQVSDVTVLKCYRKIHQKLDEILPNDIRSS